MSKKFSKKEINLYLKNKNTFYDILFDHKNYFLPARTSKAINEEFLFNVATKKAFVLKRDQIIEPPMVKTKLTSIEIYEELVKLKGDIFGFDVLTLPDKPYLTKLLYNLDTNHSMFNFKLNESDDEEAKELPNE